MPVYTIYLSSYDTDYARNDDVVRLALHLQWGTHRAWEINWDRIFNGDNRKYSKCRLRTNFISSGIGYTIGFNNGTGYLTINTPCITNAPHTFAGCPQLLTAFSNVPTITSGTYTYCISRNRLDSVKGINIVPPTNRGYVSYNLNQADVWEKMTVGNETMNFQIHLAFEFYD